MDPILLKGVRPLIETMKNFYPFLDGEDLKLVIDNLYPKCYKKGEFFIQEGQPNKEIGFNIKGAFRQFYIRRKKEINVHFILENDFLVAYPSMLLKQPSKYYIQAMEDSEVVVYPTDDLEKLYSSTRNWERYGRKVAQHILLQLNDQLESFLSSNGGERYLELTQNHPEWLRRIPLQYLASYLGLEKETLSRLRGSQRKKKI